MAKETPVIQGVALTGSLVTYYTVPTTDPQTKQVRLTGMRFINTDTVERTVTVHIIPAGGAAGVANTRFKTLTIQPSSLGYPPPYFAMTDVLLQGTFIQASASAANVVAMSADGVVLP